MKQRISFLPACTFLCSSGRRVSEAEQTFFATDTVMSVQVSGRHRLQAVAAAREAVERLDGLLSRTDSDSQIAQLNTAIEDGAAVAMDPDVAELLAFSRETARQFPGDLDITTTPVMDAWDFTTEEWHVPAPDTLVTAMALVNSEEFSVDTETSAASLARTGTEVDLGAVVKGFVTCEVRVAIRDAGGTSAMLDLGGNVTVAGAKGDSSPWRVAVKDPQGTGSYLCVLTLTDMALSVSGGYERYSEEDGVRCRYIIDPETSYPADSGLLSITVVSADHPLTNALSTTLSVARPEEALDFQRNQDDFELVLCTGQRELLVTEGLEDVFTSIGADRGYTYGIARR